MYMYRPLVICQFEIMLNINSSIDCSCTACMTHQPKVKKHFQNTCIFIHFNCRNQLKYTTPFASLHAMPIVQTDYCLRSRPVSPNVVRSSVRVNVENDDRMTE